MLTEAALSLILACPGTSSTVAATSASSATATNNYGDRVNVYGSTIEPVEMSGTVEVRIDSGSAVVMVPAQFTGGSGGTKWRKVKNLVVTDDEITGKVGLGLLASTTFRIDRRSGTLTSNGGFRGQCTKIDATKRAF